MDPAGCLATDALLEFVEGTATPDRRAIVESHASRCARCRRALSSLTESTASHGSRPSGDEPTIQATVEASHTPLDGLRSGDTVSRYVIRARLGTGGMGVVYAAFDPELGREVAIKLLQSGFGSSAARTMLEERLRREARALAQLAHPNVVAVHDVGRVGDQLFIAMELIEGPTVSAWCRAEARSPRAVLERFVEAGRGLAAAHAAGIVHRDVKPENMMIGKDGRVRVVDFGLARTAASVDPEPTADGEVAAAGECALTVTGAVMGTPQYMAPEQHRGEEADARTDQFAFCVGLYTALYGIRPFAGDDLASLAAAVNAGELREPPRTRGVPGRIRRALRRGLSATPADRWPSLDALLAQIAPARYRRWVPIAAGLGAAALAATTAIVITTRASSGGAAPCGDMRGYLAGVWDAPRRNAVAAALRASGAPFVEPTVRSVTAQLDDYAARWVAVRGEACTATRVRGDQTEEVMGLRMGCLDDRLRGLDAFVARLLEGDRQTAAHAVAGAYALPDLDTCSDLAALRTPFKPPQNAQLVADVRAELATVRALDETGRYREGLAAVTALAPKVTAAAYRPLEAEVALAEGNLQYDADADDAAAAALHRAVFAAEASGDDRVALEALIELMQAESWRGKLDVAAALQPRAEAVLERLGKPAGPSESLDEAIGAVALNRGDKAGAIAAFTRAVHAAEALGTPAELRLSAALFGLAQAHLAAQDSAAGLPLLERSFAIRERLLGPEHPTIARAHISLAGAAVLRSDYDGAVDHYKRAIAILEKVDGRDSAGVAAALAGMAQAVLWQGKADDAIALMREAVAIDGKVSPAGSPDTADHLDSLASALASSPAGLAESLAVSDRAVAMYRAVFPDGVMGLATALANRGAAHLRAGHLDAAFADETEALAMARKLDPEFPTGEMERSLGQIELARHRPGEAVHYLESALAHMRDGVDPLMAKWTDGLYGTALADSGRDRAGGIARAKAAYLELHANPMAAEQEEVKDLGRWLRQAGVALPK